MAYQFFSGISYVFENACCAVAWLFSAFSAFLFFLIVSLKHSVALLRGISAFSGISNASKMPVALLHGSSHLFQLIFNFFIVSSKQPVALLHGISVF